MEQREMALSKRHTRQEKLLSEHTKALSPLDRNTVVMVQNQTGRHVLKWDKSGTIVEVLPFDQYRVRMDGSGRVSTRNRKFIKPISPYSLARDFPGTAAETSLTIDSSPPDTVLPTDTISSPPDYTPTSDPPTSEPPAMTQGEEMVHPLQVAADTQVEPAQPRSSGRTKTPNIRLTGYVLDTITIKSFKPAGSQK